MGTNRFFALAATILALVWLPGLVEAGTERSLNDQLERFHENPDPDRVAGLLAQIVKAGGLQNWKSQPPVIGFLAGLFWRHPERVAGWISGTHDKPTQQVIVWALIMSDHKAYVREFALRHGWSPEDADAYAGKDVTLQTLTINSASALDIYWGASFATGSPIFVKPIIKKFAEALESRKFALEDLITLARSDRRSQEKHRGVANKYPQDSLEELAVYAAALWALGSNGKQQKFIADVIAERIAAEPNSDLAYALRRSLFHSRAKTVVNLTGEQFEAMVSHTTDGRIREKINADFNNYREVNRNYRQFFRKGEPAHVAVTLMQRGVGSISFDVTLTTPGGSSHFHGPYTAEGAADGRIWIAAIPIDPAHLEDEGIYTVEARFRDGNGPYQTVENQFFVGGR